MESCLEITSGLKELKNIETSKCLGLEISQNNVIALNVGTGVHIIELDASAVTYQLLRRFFIQTSYFLPLCDVLSSTDDEFIWSLDFESTNKLMASADVARFLTTSNRTKATISTMKFSPILEGFCFLGCLTTHGSLDICHWKLGEWVVVANAAETWANKLQNVCKKPTTLEEWEKIFGEGIITAFDWMENENKIYLLTVMKNGDVVIFRCLKSGEATLEFISKVESKLTDACAVHGLVLNDQICVIVGSRSGDVVAQFLDMPTWTVVRMEHLLNNQDKIQPHPILHIRSHDSTHICINKRNFVIVCSVGANYSLSTIMKEFDDAVDDIKVYRNSIYTVHRNLKIVQVAIPTCEVLAVWDELSRTKTCQGAACSSSGLIWIIATSYYTNKCRLIFHTSSSFAPLMFTHRYLENCNYLPDNMDVLWLRKLAILETEINISNAGSITVSPKLQYWERRLKIACLGHNDEDEKILRNLEKKVAFDYSESEKQLRPILDEIYSASSGGTCALCSSPVVYQDVKQLLCAKSHAVPRCCISLKPCLTAHYAVCSICDAVALNEAVLLCNKSVPQCIFCDGQLLMLNAMITSE